jgi:hypothetical protein
MSISLVAKFDRISALAVAEFTRISGLLGLGFGPKVRWFALPRLQAWVCGNINSN